MKFIAKKEGKKKKSPKGIVKVGARVDMGNLAVLDVVESMHGDGVVQNSFSGVVVQKKRLQYRGLGGVQWRHLWWFFFFLLSTITTKLKGKWGECHIFNQVPTARPHALITLLDLLKHLHTKDINGRNHFPWMDGWYP